MIQLYVDGADLEQIERYAADDRISGFTCNPTMLRQLGVTDYSNWAVAAADHARPKPISFEVVSDTSEGIVKQGLFLHGLAENIYVKVPSISTTGDSNITSIRALLERGVKVNVTTVFSIDQASEALSTLNSIETPSIISVFAGKLGDIGIDASSMVSMLALRRNPHVQILWCAVRELWNITQAESAKADIITMSPTLIDKALSGDRHLTVNEACFKVVNQFYTDAREGGLVLPC